MSAEPESIENASKRRVRKSFLHKLNEWLHLWLGLTSGVIVLVVCLTGFVWVFNEEITYLLEPAIRAEKRNQPVLKPSAVLTISNQKFPKSHISYAYYQQGTAIRVGIGEEHDPKRHILFLNPYTGQIQGSKTYEKSETAFFDWILLGHRYLWLPQSIGRPIVNYGTLVFVVLLITGLIWWYPAKWTANARKRSFRIKWKAGWKRINLDLHNVLGFYAFLVLLALALSGVVFGLTWYSRGLYWITSGGNSEPEWKRVSSDTSHHQKRYTYAQSLDMVWEKMLVENQSAGGFFYPFPDSTQAKSTINIRTYPSPGKFYDVARHTYDRHSLQRLKFYEVFDHSYQKSSLGAKIRRMNYDIHIGTIFGLPGKVLAGLCSLIGASLPVSGFIIWWNRKGFGRKKSRNPVPGKVKLTRVVPKISCLALLFLFQILLRSVL